ncbi:MAG: hypothetical protein V3T72_11735 [Thermoanaerobaculia bacterium]
MPRHTIVLIALVAFSCGRPAPPDPVPPEPVPPPAAGACGQLNELACINSGRCSLVVAEDSSHGYLCRDATGPCEIGFRQRGGDAEACAAKPGCRFVPGRCYCSPDVTCICGGGPPPQCVES